MDRVENLDGTPDFHNQHRELHHCPQGSPQPELGTKPNGIKDLNQSLHFCTAPIFSMRSFSMNFMSLSAVKGAHMRNRAKSSFDQRLDDHGKPARGYCLEVFLVFRDRIWRLRHR